MLRQQPQVVVVHPLPPAVDKAHANLPMMLSTTVPPMPLKHDDCFNGSISYQNYFDNIEYN